MSSEPRSNLQCRSLGREDPLEKGMATHSSVLPGESHGQRSLAGYSPRVTKSRTRLSNYTIAFARVALMLKYLSAGAVSENAERRPACVLRITGRSAGDFTFSMVDARALQNHSCFM